ncbi:MAG TPA: hypothetical protein VFI39_06650 [Gemmatimonadales bacterium]|nr:hypothetical protein [Gemmatimonadales bacterium]
MSEHLAEVLADAREKVATVRSFGHPETAVAVEQILDRLGATPEIRSVLTFHDEKGAALLSRKSPAWFRARFIGWERRGLARRAGRTRFYAEAVIEFTEQHHAITADAEATAELERRAS